MNEQAQRIAIAEACGWSAANRGLNEWACVTPDGEERSRNIDQERGLVFYYYSKEHALAHGTPDYLHDLNAMHEAEKVMADKFGYMVWFQEMGGAAPFCYFGGNEHVWRIANATASQRAEAFLRTIGKWKD